MLSVLVSGQTVTASIGAKAEVDTYTINGVAGGAILATVAETTAGSALTPRIELHAPGGALLAANQNASGTTITANALAASGTYTLLVRDYTNANTGGYAITAASLGAGIAQNTGGDGGSIGSGVTKTATIGTGDIDIFTVNGVAGGSLLATVGETSAGSPLTPQMAIYSPSGGLLTFNQNASGTTLTVNNTLPATGTYFVMVRDYTGLGTSVGNYALTVASLGAGIAQDAGGDAGPTSSALTRTANIGTGDIDIFTINGVAGGSLLATVGEATAGSPLTPQIAVYSGAGKLLTFNQNASGTTLTVNNTLPATGTYYVMVRDYTGLGTSVGNYSMTVVSLGAGMTQNSGGDAGPTTSGLTKSANLGAGDIDVFTINGVAGGSLLATVGESTTGSPLTPQIALYSPDGKLLTFNQNAVGTNITLNNTLPSNGTYYVLVRDYTGLATSVGNYAVTAVSIGPGIAQDAGGDGGPLTSGVTKSATVAVGDVDVFTVNGVAGGSLLATVGESVVGSALTPQVAVYSPAGKLLTFNQNAVGTNVTVNNTLPANGTYTVIVRDYTGLSTGGYGLTIASLGLGIPQDAGGDGGFLASGSPRAANISTGDIDIHPFYAVVGDKLSMTVTESVLGSALTPQMALYTPDGKLLTFNQNASTVTLNVLSAASSGIYFLIVRDYVGLSTGGYNLNLTETPSAIKPTITVAATDNLAVEGGFDNGRFTISRTNIRALPVSVGYSVTGTAANGTDYTTITGTAVIAPNSGSVAVDISAKVDALIENSESVVLTLKSGAIYTVGAPNSATVLIDDPATIRGTVFNDLDGSGGRNGTEPGLAGWKVWLDLDGDNVIDSNERSVLTDSLGAYTFTGLAPMTYQVRVAPQTNWKQTLPAGGTFQSVFVALGGTKSGVLFGERKIA